MPHLEGEHMRPKFACADFTFPLLDHNAVLDLIALLQVKGVDIGLFEERSHLQPSTQFKNVRRSARNLKKRLNDRGLQAADIFLQMGNDFETHAINHPQASRRHKGRDWFLRGLEYTAACDCRHMTGLPGAHFSGESRAASLVRSVDELAWRVEQAKAHKIVFGVEAHIGSIVPRPRLAAQLIEQVPGLTLTLDYTHFTRIGMPDSEVEPLIPYASHFHVRGARKGRLQETFAKNIVDYKRIFQVMQKTGYKGWIGLEYVWMDWEGCNQHDNLSETILFRDFFKKLAVKKTK
jgi:sugar phosphate isomerase/epimerase